LIKVLVYLLKRVSRFFEYDYFIAVKYIMFSIQKTLSEKMINYTVSRPEIATYTTQIY
ncbi:hypothetical protein L9F63_011004, partial [Diploptera punctata]